MNNAELRIAGISGPYRPGGWVDDFIAIYNKLFATGLHLRHETPVKLQVTSDYLELLHNVTVSNV
jgi:hypothetical protein